MEGSGKIECPICQKSFDSFDINRHVEDCLKITNDNDNANDNSTISRKRKSNQSDAWGCLQPRESESATSVQKSKRHKVTYKTSSNAKSNKNSTNVPFLDSSQTQQGNTKEESIVIDNDADIGIFDRKSGSTLSTATPVNLRGKDVKDRIATTRATGVESQKMNFVTDEQPASQKSRMTLKNKPLAEQMRPLCFKDYVGQSKAVGEESMLRSLLQSEHIPSLILWGPPGCGKTTLARIIATNCKSSQSLKFKQLSAASAGVNDVKEVIKLARNDQNMFRKQTILFLDEIHRFNKTQQDSLLPHVEDGTIVLIGATTENPSFQVNSALLSRCRVIVLEKLTQCDLERILRRATDSLDVEIIQDKTELQKNGRSGCVCIEQKAITTLANLCDGDARAALNGLHMAIQSHLCSNSNQSQKVSSSRKCLLVTEEDIKEGLQRSHVLYDRAGEEHYNIISALHKSIRGSDCNASLYWLARMLEGGENPLYIARRLVRFASEDIGLADPLALNQAVAAYQACHFIGMPECDVILSQCVVYMCRAPKSVEVYKAYSKAKNSVCNHQGALPSVPLHLRNAPTKLMKSLDYGKGYKYNPNYKEPVDQEYLPAELRGLDFFS